MSINPMTDDLSVTSDNIYAKTVIEVFQKPFPSIFNSTWETMEKYVHSIRLINSQSCRNVTKQILFRVTSTASRACINFAVVLEKQSRWLNWSLATNKHWNQQIVFSQSVCRQLQQEGLPQYVFNLIAVSHFPRKLNEPNFLFKQNKILRNRLWKRAFTFQSIANTQVFLRKGTSTSNRKNAHWFA